MRPLLSLAVQHVLKHVLQKPCSKTAASVDSGEHPTPALHFLLHRHILTLDTRVEVEGRVGRDSRKREHSSKRRSGRGSSHANKQPHSSRQAHHREAQGAAIDGTHAERRGTVVMTTHDAHTRCESAQTAAAAAQLACRCKAPPCMHRTMTSEKLSSSAPSTRACLRCVRVPE